MLCEDCLALGIPERLCSDGKPTLDLIDSTDYIYRRHNVAGSIEEIKALTDAEIGKDLFKLFDDSYNLSSLCETHLDVLYNDNPDEQGAHFKTLGVIGINVDSLESENFEYLSNGVMTQCNFKVHHKPEPCNYAHAEIIYYMNGEKYEGKSPSKSAKTFFRRQLKALMIELKMCG